MIGVASALHNNSHCRFDIQLSAPLNFRFDAIVRMYVVILGQG